MRFKRIQKDVLKHYGLSYLLDESVTVWVGEDNLLHKPGGCSYELETYRGDHEDPKGTVLDVKVGDINQLYCSCLENVQACGKAFHISASLRPVYRRLKEPVPSLTNFNKLKSACSLVIRTDIVLLKTSSSWFTNMEPWRETFANACEELREHNENIRQMIFSYADESSQKYGISAMFIESSTAAKKLGSIPVHNDLGESVNLVETLMSGSHAFALDYWLRLVWDGVNVKDRRRKTMKIVGSTLVKRQRQSYLPNFGGEFTTDIRRINDLILELEAEFVAAPKVGSDTFLVVDEVSSSDPVTQVLAEHYTLQADGNMRLLAVPEGALQIFNTLKSPCAWTLMPSDEKIRETAVKMWDSDTMSVLFSPANLVDIADTLLQNET